MKSSSVFAILLAILALAATLRASTVTADSGNTVVDTRISPPVVTVTMRRAKSAVLENTGQGSGIDDELLVKGTDRAALSQQLALTGEMNPSFFENVEAHGGLVADR